MGRDNAEYSSAGLADQRLNDLLARLGQQGLTQNQVAARAALPAQYLSDIKRGRRPLTELVARRLGEEFDVNFEWLLGTSDSTKSPKSQLAANSASSRLWLPMFFHPIEGEPRTHPKWNGTGVELAGMAAVKAVLAQQPYVLRFGHTDTIKRRLQKGDLVLISQAPNEDAEMSIVRHHKKSFLVRANDDGTWSRVANGAILPSSCPLTGHCVGIVWSSCA